MATGFFRVYICAILFFLLSCTHRENTAPEQVSDPLFQLLPGTQTGIQFNNTVVDDKTFNVFKYRNFYNGGGVAIGDIDNDGKPDIFFVANQGKNKLFLNKGNWKFEDITDKAGLAGIHKWHTGVTMVDINGDGWLDIYISNSGEIEGDDRANELYINQKDGTFKEEARQYGLDDKGLGTHAIFFDYDHDGDLDCFILNNSYRPIESFGYNHQLRDNRDPRNGDKLYRNDNGKFTDVSLKAGIFGSEIGFGLGVAVADLNNDGWEDLYVSNDFFERDYMYINQHNGTFKEVITEATGHISLSSMGSDVVDINNDGLPDIFTTDMLPENDYRLKTTTRFDDYDVHNAKLQNDFHHQFTSNCLQLNNGDGTFSEIAQLAGVDATDWSWGALGFDFDNDGWKDLFVSNGISKDVTDQDFLDYFSSDLVMNQVRNGGFKYKEMLDRIPSTPISNYAFINQKNLTFKNRAVELGLATPSFSNGAAYGDLDGDGDLDLVVNNENKEAFVYRNMTSEKFHTHYFKIKTKGHAPNTMGVGARVTIYTHGMQQMLEQQPTRGFESSVEPVLHFGLGNDTIVDSLIIRWPNLKVQILKAIPADKEITLNQDDAHVVWKPPVNSLPICKNITNEEITGDVLHKENNYNDFLEEHLIPKMLSTEGPKLAIGDVNGDGLQDFFIGGAKNDTAKIFIQQSDGHFIQKSEFIFAQDKDYEDVGAVFFDADNDGDLDLAVASGGNQDKLGSPFLFSRLYLNDGKGNFVRSFQGWPLISVNASCIKAIDFDGDGKQDLFIGARSVPGAYGVAPSSVLLHNDGNGFFSDVTATVAPELKSLGMITDAQWADIDEDGQKELIIAGDWMPLTILKYKAGKLQKVAELPNSSGWWNCLTVADVNGDGHLDLIAGNFGQNSRIKADSAHPAKLYVSDFNKNGRTLCIPVYYKSDGKAYPYNLRSDIVMQVPTLKKKFLRYSSYAGKSIEEIFPADQLQDAHVLSVQMTQTALYLNDGKGHFTLYKLPVQAQFSPVYGILVMDLNGDGIQDIFMGGNFFALKPEVGRYDASYGATFLGNRSNGLTYIPPAVSGLFVKGEIRDIQKIGTVKGDRIIVARNNDSLQIFRKTK